MGQSCPSCTPDFWTVFVCCKAKALLWDYLSAGAAMWHIEPAACSIPVPQSAVYHGPAARALSWLRHLERASYSWDPLREVQNKNDEP